MAGENSVPGMPDGGEPGDTPMRRMINELIEAAFKNYGGAFQQYVDTSVTQMRDAIVVEVRAALAGMTGKPAPARSELAGIPGAPQPAPEPAAPLAQTVIPPEAEAEASQGLQLPAGATMGQTVMALLLPELIRVGMKFVESKVIAPTPSAFDPSRVSLSDIKKISELKPDEFGFVAQQVLPDPLNEYMPAEQARAFQSGFKAAQRAKAWTETGEDPGDQPLIPARRVVRRLPPGATSTPTPPPPPVSNESTASAHAADGRSSGPESPGSRFAVLAQRGRA